jgi:Ca2+-binding EF-hand superfamily protein
MDVIARTLNIPLEIYTPSEEEKPKVKPKEEKEVKEVPPEEALEALLQEKIRQRTNCKEDKGRTLRRAIKYVDTKDTGAITLQQFSDLLVNIGCPLNPNDTKLLFWRFADHESMKINAERLCNYFALKGAGDNPNVKPSFKLEPNPPTQVLNKIRRLLKEKGDYGIKELEKLFKKADASGNKKLDRHEFAWILKENGHRLLPLEFERLFKYFDRNNDNEISYEEFVYAIKGELNLRRKTAIEEMFKCLDVTGTGKIPLADLLSYYRVESHPKVVFITQS